MGTLERLYERRTFFSLHYRVVEMKRVIARRATFAAIGGCLIGSFVLGSSAANPARGQTYPAEVKRIMGKYACVSCHAFQGRLVGPSWSELAERGYSAKQLTALMRQPKPENWPNYPPMEPIAHFAYADAKAIAQWLNQIKSENKHAKKRSF